MLTEDPDPATELGFLGDQVRSSDILLPLGVEPVGVGWGGAGGLQRSPREVFGPHPAWTTRDQISHVVLEGLGISWRRQPGLPAGIVAPATGTRRGAFVQKSDLED